MGDGILKNIFRKLWKSRLALLLAGTQLVGVSTVLAKQTEIMDLPVEIQETTKDYANDGVQITQIKGSLPGINDLYAFADYTKVVDLENDQVMSGIAMANEEVTNRIKEAFGSGTKAVFSYIEDQDKATISFVDETGQLLKDVQGQDASYSFVGKARSNQVLATVNGIELAINRSGATIDLNFNDGTGWQPGELFFIPSQSSFHVKWVNALTGEELYDSVTPTIFSGERFTTKALPTPTNYEYLGLLKTGESYEINQNGTFEEPAIKDSQVNKVMFTTGKLNYEFDHHLLADYTINSYLSVGESYTIGLQDYVYEDNTKPIGQSSMTYKPIDLTVTRLNEAGDVRLLLTDITKNENQTLTVRHGESVQYSNPNDFWHYYEKNPEGSGWTARTFHNNLALNSPADATYVYKPVAKNPVIEKKVNEQEHVDLATRKETVDWRIQTTFGNQTASWKQAAIIDSINPLLEIKKIVLTDESGTSVIDNGTLDVVDNKITFNINKKGNNFSYLSNQTYVMTVTTAIKPNVTERELRPYLKNEGIPNQALLSFGEDEQQQIVSQIPTISPPNESTKHSTDNSSDVIDSSDSDETSFSTENRTLTGETNMNESITDAISPSEESSNQSVDEIISQNNVHSSEMAVSDTDSSAKETAPVITKDIEGKESLKLTDTTKTIEWHLKVDFGTDTKEWARANIVDVIPSVLTVEKVVVRNQKNQVVTHEGNLSIHNNRVVFTIHKKNGDFTHLAGESYTMTITTKVKKMKPGEQIILYATQ